MGISSEEDDGHTFDLFGRTLAAPVLGGVSTESLHAKLILGDREAAGNKAHQAHCEQLVVATSMESERGCWLEPTNTTRALPQGSLHGASIILTDHWRP